MTGKQQHKRVQAKGIDSYICRDFETQASGKATYYVTKWDKAGHSGTLNSEVA